MTPATLASHGYIDHQHTVADEPGLSVLLSQADILESRAHPNPRFDLPGRSAHRQPPVISFNVENSGGGTHDAPEVSVERARALRDALTAAVALAAGRTCPRNPQIAATL